MNPVATTPPGAPGPGSGSPWRGLQGDALWQVADRGTRLALGFAMSVLIARTLGPADFGVYAYALSLVVLFAFLGQAGLDGLLVRELVRNPGGSAEVIGSSLVLRLIGGALAGLASIAVAVLAWTEELALAPSLVMIMAFTGLMQAGWVVEAWLQANGGFRRASLAKIAAYLCATSIRIAVLQLPDPLVPLAVVTVVESGLCTLLLWLSAARQPGRTRLIRLPSLAHVSGMARMVGPMLASGLMIAVDSRIDTVMLGYLAGAYEAGLYGAASLLSEGFYFIPVAFMAAAAPRLARLFAQDPASFDLALGRILRWLSLAGLVLAVSISLSPLYIVGPVFGPEYLQAETMLRIHIWSTWLVFLSTAGDQWYINRDLRGLYLLRCTLSAALNIGLNLLLIPRWQGAGAALATLLSYFFYAIVFSFLVRETRPFAWLQARAVLGMGSQPEKASPAR